MEKTFLDIFWLIVCTGFVLLMQGGFLCLETGLTRSKNNINVAAKNVTDLSVSLIIFWVFGYALMFGSSVGGGIGFGQFVPDLGQKGMWFVAFFLFQAMFCGTAVTILSGAVAERLRFIGYIIVAVLISSLIYPIFGHWVWNGATEGKWMGWLGQMGFRDFAGATVVHSVGGWASLAILIVIGPRDGRFAKDGNPVQIQGSSLPVAMLGVIFLWLGWVGFNGGSTFAMNDVVPTVIANTTIAGASGLVGALGLGWFVRKRPDVDLMINGSLAGLVASTACADMVSTISIMCIGLVGGWVMLGVDHLLLRFRVDDAVGAVPVHLGAGIWGTVAVALFVPSDLGFWSQLGIQMLGIVACFLWAFGVVYIVFYFIHRFFGLRVSREGERVGLNVSEHNASSELLNLFNVMDQQSQTGDLSLRAPVEPFTEVGQIAGQYNRVMQALEDAQLENSVRESIHRAVLATALDCIITMDQAGNILEFNPAAEETFGYRREEVIGRSLVETIIPESYREAHCKGLAHYLKTGKRAVLGERIEVEGMRPDGTVFPVELSITPSKLRDGTEVFTGYLRDISERKQRSEALEAAKEQAEAANKAKSAFLANMSHELRTPLNAVIGMSDMLLEKYFGELNDHQEDYVQQISKSGQHLLSLINDILDLSKVEAGFSPLELAKVDLGTVLDKGLDFVREQAQDQKVELVVQISENLPSVVADERKVVQVVINLLSNAVKFTPEGGQVGIEAVDVNKGVRICVWDTGIGIAPEDQNEIFGEFVQLEDTSTRNFEGTGLGLALVKKFVEQHSGEVGLESELGRGSRFYFVLPLVAVSQEDDHGNV